MACATCRSIYASRQVGAIQEAFAGASNDSLAFVTIVMGLTSWTGDIREIFDTGRRKLRNMVDRNRRADARWSDLQIVGWLEVDAFDPHRFADLPANKRVQLEAIGLPYIGAGPTWVVTLHALVSLAGVDRYRLTEELQRSWAAPTQVHVCEFHGDKSPDQNINSLVRYCLKHQTDTATTVCHAEPWDISWKTEYYEYLYRWSKGFQSLRVWVKPRAAEPARSQDARTGRHSAIESAGAAYSNDVESDDSEEGYMPFTF